MEEMHIATEQAQNEAHKAAADASAAEHQQKAQEMEAMHVAQEMAEVAGGKGNNTVVGAPVGAGESVGGVHGVASQVVGVQV